MAVLRLRVVDGTSAAGGDGVLVLPAVPRLRTVGGVSAADGDGALALTAVPWLRTADAAPVVDVVRRWTVGRAICSWLWLPCVALSDFERAVARLLEVAGFTCSLPSGVSDIFFMLKMTPFYD
jgi:hypothetical protein